jgi:acyl-CoA synthetase (NDP forming)
MAGIPDLIFRPSSIAVIGASDDPGKLGYMVTKAFVDMGVCERIYPVNPRQRQVQGFDAVPSAREIGTDGVDLAVVVLPPAAVPDAVRDCVAKGTKGIIVFSSLIGDNGHDEAKIVEYARWNGTRIIGPDSMGMYCPSGGLALFPDMPRESGPVAFLSHSGAIAYMVSHYGVSRGVRFSKVVDCGNECDLSFADFLQYLEHDHETRVISGYIEGVKDGKRFLEAAASAAEKKPVILLKSGVTERSRYVVASHTGFLAGSPMTWDSAFKQANLVRVDSIDEMIDCQVMFDKLPPLKGRRIALISGTGGPLVMATDLCARAGFQIPTLSPETRERIERFLPPYGTSAHNPVDLSISAGVNVELYSQSVNILGSSDEVDVLMLIHAGEWRGNEVAECIAEAAKGSRNPVVTVMLGTPEKTLRALAILADAGVAAFPSLERTVKCLASFTEYHIRAPR